MLEWNHDDFCTVVAYLLDIGNDGLLDLFPDIGTASGLALHGQRHIPKIGLTHILYVSTLGECQREACQGSEGQQYSFHHLLVTLMLLILQIYIFSSKI